MRNVFNYLAVIVFISLPIFCGLYIIGIIGGISAGGRIALLWRTVPAFAILGAYAYLMVRVGRWDE